MTVRGDATATGRLRAPLLVLLDEADCLDASHDRLAQIAAEPVLTTLRSTAIAWVPSWKGVMTITRRLGLLKLNFDQRCVCHFCTKAYYYSAVSAAHYGRPAPAHRGEAPALADMLGGQVQVIFGSIPGTLEYIRSGTLRPLAVTTAMRSEALPDIPILGDFVPGYEVSSWLGVGVPMHTPAEIIDKLNKEINAGFADPKLKARFADLGATMFPLGSPTDFSKFVADETEKYAKVVKFAGIKGLIGEIP
jgi:hypothetical protein